MPRIRKLARFIISLGGVTPARVRLSPRRLLLTLGVIHANGVALVFLLLLCDHRIVESTRAYHSSSLESLPNRQVGLVLGCSERLSDGRLNLYFQNRMDAAARLYHHGKVRHIIVSGDNGSANYDETLPMLQALVQRGVPEKAITRDHAGFDTLDSVVRADEVFGAETLIVVSQPFHNERAIYIARSRGQDAWGYDAEDVAGSRAAAAVRLREYLARIKAMLDLHLLRSRPTYLGDPIKLPG